MNASALRRAITAGEGIVAGVLLVPCPEGHIAVAQPAHGWTCGQLGRAWGNELFGDVTPFEEVVLAAEQHDTGWAEWEQGPTLDPTTGLPHTFATAPYTVHLAIHLAWSRALVAQSRYAALLVSLHHASFFERPGRAGRLREGGRLITAFRDALDELGGELRRTLGVPVDEVERNRRLVRTWDGISHDFLIGTEPRVRRDVPARGGLVEVTVARDGDRVTLDPWPFREQAVTIKTEGRLLDRTFGDEQEMRAALTAAPWIELAYELRPVNAPL